MNLILATDSYKMTHHAMYPPGTERVYSYFESRKGARFNETVFFGLQPLLWALAAGINQSDIDEAREVASKHFAVPVFNEGWQYIVDELGGRLPLRIKAVPEGTPVDTGNVLMTVENTDPNTPWLTNAVESFLTHVWYPSTVASLSRTIKMAIADALEETTGSHDGLEFMLHDFGYRGATSHSSAAIGGAAHLVNFQGTDTLPALDYAHEWYAAKHGEAGFSVPATEHSVMTSLGEDGEPQIIERLLSLYPEGILSVVGDSYDYYRFVDEYVGVRFATDILHRDGVFVVRPDSVTRDHDTPAKLVAWTLDSLWSSFGGTTNARGFKVLDPHVRVLWGDGIDAAGIVDILATAMNEGFAASNLVFGMGGGLLQKVNRDTQRFAFKSSAQYRDGQWHDVFKRPLDVTKVSKAGRLSLIEYDHGFATIVGANEPRDILKVVFEDGRCVNDNLWESVRDRAAIPSAVLA